MVDKSLSRNIQIASLLCPVVIAIVLIIIDYTQTKDSLETNKKSLTELGDKVETISQKIADQENTLVKVCMKLRLKCDK